MRNPSLRGQRLCLQSSPSLALPDDIGGEIVRLVARQLHVRHLRVRVHQEARDRVGVEAGNLGDRGERRHAVPPVRLVGRDDVAGRAPAFRQRLAVIDVGGVGVAGQGQRGERAVFPDTLGVAPTKGLVVA